MRFQYSQRVYYIGKTKSEYGLVFNEPYSWQGEKEFHGEKYYWISNMNMPYYGCWAGWVPAKDVATDIK